MNNNCAACGKIVYPTEKLQGAPQTYHKLCFKCTECGQGLNTKSFQSHAGKPYCKAHLPKLSATAGAETLETQRLKNVSNITSNLKYHAEFEKNKGDQGSFASAALDAPEMQRAKNVSNIVSNVKYHADFEKNKGDQGTFASAALQAPEMKMNLKNSNQVSQVKYHGGHEPASAGGMPNMQPQSGSQHPGGVAGGKAYRAVYQYAATVADELGIEVGDEIVDVQNVSEGWIHGRNKRTGATGLLPEPYCQPI